MNCVCTKFFFTYADSQDRVTFLAVSVFISSFKSIIQYIDDQFERFLRDESGLNRRNINDSRVHCCFYFISPFGHGLKPLDIEFMRQLHGKVNIVPVIAKADALTKKEVMQLKKKVI